MIVNYQAKVTAGVEKFFALEQRALTSTIGGMWGKGSGSMFSFG